MKKYFYAKGEEHLGPYSIEELVDKNINGKTLVWCEGMENWAEANTIDEIKKKLIVSPPPVPGMSKTPPPVSKEPILKSEEPYKSKSTTTPIVAILITAVVVISLIVFRKQIFMSNSGNSSTNSSTFDTSAPSYEEQVKSVEEIESESPTNYLSTSGTFRENLLGGKLVINGKITSSATKASYKDAEVEVIFYSKTGTELGYEYHTIYEIINPYKTIDFELRVTNYRNVSSVGLEVVSAVAL